MGLPLIDLTAAPAQVARQIDIALREVGFFCIVGHGVPQAVQAAAFSAGRRFFGLPLQAKERWHINLSSHKRGYDPIGWQSLDPGQPPDVKESFYMGRASHGPNPWPDVALVPGFQAACEAYSNAMLTLAQRLMGLFELALDLPAGHFNTFMQDPTCTTRLLRYPPQPATPEPGQIGCGAHTDWGALTLLAQDDAGGLQVQPPGQQQTGNWLDVPPHPGALVVNVGDMMQRWTNDRWPSTLHRVINHHAGRDRQSIAYFFDLDGSAAIEPLAVCVDATHPARYGPITAADHLQAMYRRTTVTA